MKTGKTIDSNDGGPVCQQLDANLKASMLESEETFHSYFWKNKAVMLVIDSDSLFIVDANPAAATYYGYSLEQLKQMKISDINTMQTADIKKKIKSAMSQKENTFLFTHRLSSGDLRQVEVFSTPVRIMKQEALLSIIHDITERKTMEDSLRDSEMRFRNLLRALPLPIAVINKDGVHAYINEKFEQVFGYGQNDLTSRERWRELAYPDVSYRQRITETWRAEEERARMDGKDIGPLETAITCKDGLIRSVIICGIVLGDEIVATFTDITDRLRHEQVLKRTYERRRKGDVMNELLRGSTYSKKLVFECAHVLGEKMMLPYTCAFIQLGDNQKISTEYSLYTSNEYQQLRDTLIDTLETETQIAWESPDGIGVLVFHEIDVEPVKEKQFDIANQLWSTASAIEKNMRIFVGVAESANNIIALGEKFRQASTAAITGSKVWPQKNIYHYSDLGVYQLLACFREDGQINDYIERTLGKILHYDPQKLSTYLDTLEVILMSDNLKESADKLFIHYQTLMFRKRRLEKLLDVSLEDGATKLAILTALHLLKLKRN